MPSVNTVGATTLINAETGLLSLLTQATIAHLLSILSSGSEAGSQTILVQPSQVPIDFSNIHTTNAGINTETIFESETRVN